MAHLLTDVTPILTRAFPNGKPEMSASDFDRALKFVQGRRAGTIPVPGPLSMDYAWWAHTMIVEWRMMVEDWEQQGKKGPEPAFLLCPECNVMLILDTQSADVLLCPGGCHRAITVSSFTQLFKPPPKPKPVPFSLITAHSPPYVPVGGGPTKGARTQPNKASLDMRVPAGKRPEDYGITEGVKKSRNPLQGWRMWEVRPEAPNRLYSLHIAKNAPWLPMDPARGTCNGKDPSDVDDHTCPSWEHRCGIHAVKTVEQLKKWGSITTSLRPDSSFMRIPGTIEMWGRVLEYTEGYRAEWAYPLKLYLPKKIPLVFDSSPEVVADLLWRAYLTEVEVGDFPFNQFED